MKEWANCSLYLVLLILGTGICVAQDRVEISTDPPPPMIKLPVVKEVGKAQAVYDERGDATIVQTRYLQVQGDWRNGILLRASFRSQGKNISKPSFVTFTFSSMAGDRTYADQRELKISLDGRPALSGVAQYVSGYTDGVVYSITVKQDIPYDLFLEIVSAKGVKIQLGPTEFELKESDVDALRDVRRAVE